MYHQRLLKNHIFYNNFKETWICLIRSDPMNVSKDFMTISYSLLCDTAINMEVIEPTLVILVSTGPLLFFPMFIIRIFSFKCSTFRFINFCCYL